MVRMRAHNASRRLTFDHHSPLTSPTARWHSCANAKRTPAAQHLIRLDEGAAPRPCPVLVTPYTHRVAEERKEVYRELMGGVVAKNSQLTTRNVTKTGILAGTYCNVRGDLIRIEVSFARTTRPTDGLGAATAGGNGRGQRLYRRRDCNIS